MHTFDSFDSSSPIHTSYLRTLFPLSLAAASLIFLVASLIFAALNSKYYHAYTLLNNWHHVWDVRIPPPDGVGVVPPSAQPNSVDDEISRNAQLALHPTMSQAYGTRIVEADKPTGEVAVAVVELLAVLAEFGISIAFIVTQVLGSRREFVAGIAGLAFWTYVLTLTVVRVLLPTSQSFSFPSVWYHTAFLYGMKWIPAVLLFRSYIIHPRSRYAQILMMADFILNSMLVLISLLSRKGNKAVELEYEEDISPAREPLASLFSLATFSWVDPVVWLGYKKTFELSDVWNISIQDKAAVVIADYRQLKKTSALALHLLKYFRAELLIQGGWACFSGVLTFVPTLLLKSILQYVEDPADTPRNSAWFFVILLFVSGCASALADGQALWVGRKICIRLRAIIVGEIYAKALRRKAGASTEKVLGEEQKTQGRKTLWQKVKSFVKTKDDEDKNKKQEESTEPSSGNVAAGTIINLMAVDSFKVAEISAYLHFLWAATPVQVVLAVVLLYQILGLSSVAGIGTMALLLPVNMYISKKFASVQKQILAATDARIQMTNEVLTNIRIIKYFAWEQRFMANIEEKRVVELQRLTTRYVLWSIAATVWGGAPVLITFLSFAFYTLVEKKALIPSTAFTALSLFQILRIPLDQLADMVAHVQESKVSVDRIEEFLSEEDTQKYKQLAHPELDDTDSEHPIIGFDSGTFTWGDRVAVEADASSSFRLIDLNVRFAVGHLNVIAGPTGSGKTSLIMALLGEMTLLEGSVYLPGGTSREDLKRNPATGLTESVAYCAQQAWLVNATVKQNIIFASPWDPKRYDAVLTACALSKDLEILDNGDETLVGEKGVTLSGGQKQRISLARAIYCNARHVLLDDVLSAVDSHTAKWIYEQALMGSLMSNRTCILVTHNLSLCLPDAEYAVVLENGRVAVQGTANKVINSGKLSEDLTKSVQGSRAPSRVPSKTKIHGDDGEDHLGTGPGDDAQNMNGHADARQVADKHETPVAGPAKATQTPSTLPLQEGKATGSVKFSIIFMYFKAMGGWFFWTCATIVFAVAQLGNVATNVWIRQWANAYASEDYSAVGQTNSTTPHMRAIGSSESCHVHGICTFGGSNLILENHGFRLIKHIPDVNAGYYLTIYGVLGLLYMVVILFREGVLFSGSLTASRRIHRQLIESVTRARFRFFDSTPLGQIMNRFSKDIENVDQDIAPVAVGVIHCLGSIITVVVLISVVTPVFIIAAIFITILYFAIGMVYINSSRDLKRLESTQRSPLYQQFGETLTGSTTIRAYGDERRFIRDNLAQINTHCRPFIYLWAANRWLAFRVDVVGALVAFFAGVFVVLSVGKIDAVVGKIDAGAAGLAMTYAVSFTENVLWFVRLYAANEQNMNSVERIKEYLDVEQEAPAHIPDTKPPANWPSKGSVEFIGYTTRYRKDFEPVLKQVTFKINPCEKVGIVGRTGAGKSSLALAMFRALEAEEGKILVDGVDIGLIGLQDLRESIVMVPQDPTLFSGTIRSNLDPFGLFTDEEIFTALRRVQLIGGATSTSATPLRPSTPLSSSKNAKSLSNGKGSSIAQSDSSTPGPPATTVVNAAATAVDNKNIFLNLTSPISDSGSNLSQGQRQLLCLARALLKSPKVLLMDEATASIDYATDAKIQETIQELKDNTIITIAHRLKTIVDYDKVVVMDHGEVVEYGEPWELLKPRDGGGPKRWFREMCEMSGELEALEKEAKRSSDARKLVDDE